MYNACINTNNIYAYFPRERSADPPSLLSSLQKEPFGKIFFSIRFRRFQDEKKTKNFFFKYVIKFVNFFFSNFFFHIFFTPPPYPTPPPLGPRMLLD